MSSPRPLEKDILSAADSVLEQNVSLVSSESRTEARLQLLEACAARLGGFNLAEYHGLFHVTPLRAASKLIELAAPVVQAIEESIIDPSLALSALAREILPENERKSTGAYHTDFRLAMRLAERAASSASFRSKVIDPACGAGILLVALTKAVCGRDRAKISRWLAEGVYAADLSAAALRGALLALASLTDDLPALVQMRRRWYCGDSLLAPINDLSGTRQPAFDVVIGNPPWEKLKLSRHEYLKSTGADRHYGDSISGIDETSYSSQRAEVANYAKRLLDRYPSLAGGEPDLYIAFTELFLALCRPGGNISVLVPGGLIRSQGTSHVRRQLLEVSQQFSVSIFENRARFFAIDTRFKFLIISLMTNGGGATKRAPIQLQHEYGTPESTKTGGIAVIGRSCLHRIRKDLSLPEVRNSAEWRVFRKISENGSAWDDPSHGWQAHFSREVDMTKEKPHFLLAPSSGSLPVVEGRMVHQHRFGVKGYLCGTGRRAAWEAFPVGRSRIQPQFWIRSSDIPAGTIERSARLRVGFCDIAGQTNERSLMAALIPPGVVCGNKVPTVIFPRESSEDRLYVFAAVLNSIPFDWALRRVLTTTVNYFLLQSVPLPHLVQGGLPWQRLLACSRELHRLDSCGYSPTDIERFGQLRAEIDTEIALAYGLQLQDLVLMMGDFPLLDRGQPPLPGEKSSTITRDMFVSIAARRMSEDSNQWQERYTAAKELGARAYVPAETAGFMNMNNTGGAHINA